MATYVVLANFTDQGVKTAKDSPKRAEAFKNGKDVRRSKIYSGRKDDMTSWQSPTPQTSLQPRRSTSALMPSATFAQSLCVRSQQKR